MNYTHKIAILLTFLLAISVNAQKLFINEFMASNVTSTPEILDNDDYSDWIELYNDSTATKNIGGYYLTDDFKNPSKWRIPDGTLIPAKGFLLFWADGYDSSPSSGSKYFHTNFSLSKDGEEIAIFSPTLVLIDSISYVSQISDVSFGRKPNGANNWNYFGESTPKTSNNTYGTLNTLISKTPKISVASGIYSGIQTVSINPADSTEFRYTLDGSLPKSSSAKYETPLTISSTTTLRVRAFEGNKLPSKIVTKSYIIDEPNNLPILSITAFPETLFGREIGIYTNEIKSREAPVNVQLFEKDGNMAFEVDAGIRLTGQASFQYPQKPLTIETASKYGDEVIDYPVFSNRPFEQYTSIYLRNSGTQDNRHTMFRDALQHTIVINQMDLEAQAYRPVATYINGQYWGIYNIREKLDDNYLVAHHGIDPDNIDYLEYEFQPEPIVLAGDTKAYFALQNFLSQNSMNIEANWEYVKSQIDINEVMNYLITELYCDNVNWPNTNSRWWKDKSENGKWRYIFLDSDYGFGAPSYYSRYYNNTFEYLYYSVSQFSSFVFRKLLENKEFKNEFIQRYATYLNTVFKRERVIGIVDSLQNQIADEMVFHIDRWDDYPEPIYGYPPIPDIRTWNTEVAIMREFADKRPQYVKQSIISFFNLSGLENLSFNLSEPNSGKITLGGIKVPDGFTGEYFRYVPIKLEAIPAVGYKFVKWVGVPDSLSSKTFYSPTRSDSTIVITAVFEEDNINILPNSITSNTTLTLAESPYYAKSDVTIIPDVTVTVEAGVEILMPDGAQIVVNGVLDMNGSTELPIVIRPNDKSGYNSWGNIYFENATEECTLNYVHLVGATNGGGNLNEIGAISSYHSNVVIENTTIVDAPFPIFIQFGNAVIRNCTLHTDETSDLINVKYAETALVENCDLRGNNKLDTDAIDYDQISNGTIRGNRIYNFYGFNSDGIDLGEGSKDILIENNLILNCNDKGISVGQASTTIIKKNIIINCAQGVGIKDDSSYALIDRNTIYGCDYGVASFEKNIGSGGGNAEIVNTIFSKSNLAPVFVDQLSKLTVDYSLSDTKTLVGNNNLKLNPQFKNNFILSSTSPAINSGNPTTEFDDDATIADMGAKYFNGIFEPIIINEIHYNPNNGDEYEFIEIYNTSDENIITSGYQIVGDIKFTFPGNSFIGPKEYQVIAKDASVYENLGVAAYSWDEGSLKNGSADLKLYDMSGKEVDMVSYSNSFGWPTTADGLGHSIELRNPLDENLVTQNWKASDVLGGSPGVANKTTLTNLVFINELQAENTIIITDEYGEFDDWIEIYNASKDSVSLGGLYITDDFTNLTKHLILNDNSGVNTVAPNEHLLLWADGNPNQGLNHLDFRLSADGEEVALVYVFENDTTVISSVKFGKQQKDFSYARVNDGDDNWHEVEAPTPGARNSFINQFKNGILVVNGLPFRFSEVVDSYVDKAFWGNFNITFWDLLTEPTNGYPSTLSNPIGHGAIPLDTLINYSTVIWTGENTALENNFWDATPILEYVKMGGNAILLFKNGRSYIYGEMLNRLGLTWLEPENATILNCIPTFDGLEAISLNSSQYMSSIFDTSFTNENTKLLFTETITHGRDVGIGIWNKPPGGGWYKKNGGQIVFLSGRAYRYESESLKHNIEYILENFLEEDNKVSVADKDNLVVLEYQLSQNYPNPFNPSTAIKYDLVKSSKVELKIFDILGQEVKTLVDRFEESGRKTVYWNGNNNFNQKVSSGIYFYRISAGEWSDIKKMILLK